MRMKMIFALLLALFAFTGTAAASAKAVPGDVLAVFRNPYPDVPVTAESLAPGSENREPGTHRAYVEAVAESLDAKVTHIYDSLSIEGGDIMALLHTDAKTEGTLWFELRMRQDVKGASLNYVRNINVGKSGGPK